MFCLWNLSVANEIKIWRENLHSHRYHFTELNFYIISQKKKKSTWNLLSSHSSNNKKREESDDSTILSETITNAKTLKRLKRDFPPFLLIAQISHILQKSMQNQREFSKIPKSPRRGIKKKLRTRVLSRRSIRTVVKSRPSSIQNWTK